MVKADLKDISVPIKDDEDSHAVRLADVPPTPSAVEPGAEKFVLLSDELRIVLEQSAKEKKVTLEKLVDVGAEIMACLPQQVWKTLRYNEVRTQRHLTPAQQIVDVLCQKYSATPPKWGRDNRSYLSRRVGE
ncbi:MAG: hypothetical protein H8D67_22935 [Deltaproteobacteria bacterium]|nr:hypothetical protein [Deltaproteobacteria bacterium]